MVVDDFPCVPIYGAELEDAAMRHALLLLIAVVLSACAATPMPQSDRQRTWDVEPCEHCMT